MSRYTRSKYYKLNPLYWLGYGLLNSLRVFCYLPFRWQLKLGKSLGRLIYRLSPSVRKVTEQNISACFPHLTTEQQQQLVHDNFDSLGMGLFENMFAAWGNTKRISAMAKEITGLDAVEQTLAKGQGVILLFNHSYPIYLAAHILYLHKNVGFSAMFHRPTSAVLNDLIVNKLEPHVDQIFDRRGTSKLISHLKKGKLVWYASDLDVRRRKNIFIPYFGIQAATLAAPQRIAKLSGAKIFPLEFYRRDDGQGYNIHIHPALENFPTEDQTQDLTRINQTIENIVKKHPEQYLWQYRRFKTRPRGEEKFYQ